MLSKICVVGSSNYDLISYTSRLPKVGETIIGTDFKMGCGGKGANQAIAAAKLGSHVTMVTKIGDDIFGKETIENYKNYKINTEYISLTTRAPSGIASISVDSSAHNSIIVTPGANNHMRIAEIERAKPAIASAQLLICQNEIPFKITQKSLHIAKKSGVTTFFNPAPAPLHKIPASFFKLIDILCLNETELELFTKYSTKNMKNIIHAGKYFIEYGIKILLITLGAKGCVFITKDFIKHIKPHKVKAIDTTGAGDCFIGSFAYFYTSGFSEYESVQKAQFVAAQSVQKQGTQISFPNRDELPQELFRK